MLWKKIIILTIYYLINSYGNDIIYPIVTYISFETSTISFPNYDINNIRKLNSSYADDTPLYSVQLEQVFPYFGKYFDKIYVSANGFVQVNPNPECGAFFCDPCHGKYYGSVGGIVTDLAPYKFSNASISSVVSNSSTVIIFSKVPNLSNNTERLSFKIALLNEGTIFISYDNTPSSFHSQKACSWFSGLVAPKNFNSSSIVTQTQQLTSVFTWSRNISGVYPSTRASTQSGTRFVACPISTTWCMTPSNISTTMTPQVVNLTTLSMSCFDPTGTSYVNWAIMISVAPNIYHSCTLQLLPMGFASELSPATLMCLLNSSWTSSINGATSATITIYWRPIDTSNYIPLQEVNSLTVQLSSADPSHGCALNSDTAFGSCTPCEVCNGNVSLCSLTSCEAIHSSQSTQSAFPSYDYPFNSLYIEPSCSIYETDTCKHSFDLETDVKGRCCEVDKIDCLGICEGNALPGYQNDGSIICCESHVDCFGVCGGKSYVDACGVCGGTDTGQKCPTYVNITTNSISSYQLKSEYNHINQTDSTKRITIHNNGNTSILVSFKLQQEVKSLDPLVMIPSGEYNITSKSSQTFSIVSNITRIYSKTSPSWEVKRILIEYTRPNQYGPIPYYIDILPLATDCDHIPGDELCVALPGCIQCLDFEDDIRVLSEDVDPEIESYPYSQYYQRQLYADIMPDIADCEAIKYHRNLEEIGILDYVNFTVIPGRDMITVNTWSTIEFEEEVILGCVAYKDRDNPPSINYMQINSIQNVVSNVSTPLYLRGLLSQQQYDIYCVSFNIFDKVTTTPNQMMKRVIQTKTLCCRPINVYLHSDTLSSAISNVDMIYLEWKDHHADLLIEFSTIFYPLDSSSVSSLVSPFQFSSLNLTTSPLTHLDLSVPRNISSGVYELSFQLIGKDSTIYDINYLSGKKFFVFSRFEIRSDSAWSAYPAVPYLTSCKYSIHDDAVAMEFNSSTNLAPVGTLNVQFNCSSLVIDQLGSIRAYFCIWVRYNRLHVYPTSHVTAANLDVLTLLSGRLKSYSSLTFFNSTINDLTKSFLSPPVQTCKIILPDCIRPRIIFSSPSQIGPYDDFTLDITGSLGNLNQNWSHFSVLISSLPSNSTNLMILHKFFSLNYSVTTPAPVPPAMLLSRTTYIFEINLCNFLNCCSKGKFSLHTIPFPVPIIELSSPKYRIQKPSVPLRLEARIFQKNATKLRESNELSISWHVSVDGVNLSSLLSTSKSPSIFRLSPGKLLPAVAYEIRVVAFDNCTLVNSSSSFYVYVRPGDVVPRIRGSLSRISIPFNSTKLIDASLSYDENNLAIPSLSNLHFQWDCYQISPVEFSKKVCGLSFSSINHGVVNISGSSVLIGHAFRVILMVVDPTYSRYNSLAFIVDISSKNFPDIQVMSNSHQYYTHNKVFIEGVLTADPSNSIEGYSWSTHPIINSFSNASVERRKDSYMEKTFPIILRPFSLTPHNSYRFTLASREIYSYLSVSILSQPTPGGFRIIPEIGTEFSSLFALSTSFWSDNEDSLPILYNFGYLSPYSSTPLVLRQTYQSRISTYLPHGNDLDFSLVCFVQGVNVYGAASNRSFFVKVETNLGQGDSLSLISNTDFASSNSKFVISSGATILNWVNHTCAINCTELGRYPCISSSYLSNTCGKCLPGYFADQLHDESNTPCLNFVHSVNDSIICSSTNECHRFYTCISGKCLLPQKRCINDCSARGTCVYYSRITQQVVINCNVFDATCDAVCVCWLNYSKVDCSLSSIEFSSKLLLRTFLMRRFQDEISKDDLLHENIVLYVAQLTELLHLPDEVDRNICSIFFDAFSTLSDAIKETTRPFDDFLQISNSFSICSRIVPSETRKHFLFFLDLLADHMMPYEETLEVVDSRLRYIVDKHHALLATGKSLWYMFPQQSVAEHKMISLELKSHDPSLSLSPSSVIISQFPLSDSNIVRQYSAEGYFLSSPVRVFVNTTIPSSITYSINFSVPESQPYDSTEPESYLTVCDNTKSESLYVCGNQYRIRHHCDGIFTGVIRTECPTRTIVPLCLLVERDGFELKVESNCGVKVYDNLSISCHCSLQSRHLEIVAYQSFEYHNLSTFAIEVNDSEVDSVMVAILFMFLWFAILAIAFLCHYVDSPAKSYSVSNLSTNIIPPRSLKRRGRKSCPSGSLAAYAYVLKYIDKTIPFVFRPKKSLAKHLSYAVFQHHRYLRIFTSSSGNSYLRILQVFHFLTVQSVVLFLLLLLLELQYPSHSRLSCHEHTTAESCNRHKSFLDSDVPICHWIVVNSTENLYTCHQSSIHLTGEVFFVVVMILAFLGGIINIFIDPLFWILQCPVENSLRKVEDTTHPKFRRLRTQQLSVIFRKAISDRFNVQNILQIFDQEKFMELFFKREQVISLSNRLINWHDLIVPSLAKLESDLDFLEKFSFVNQRGNQATIDTSGLLFTGRSQKLVSGTLMGNNSTVHHFMHQLKQQHSSLTGEKRKAFEESWSISPFTGTFTETRSRCGILSENHSVEHVIFQKIDKTTKESLMKSQNLKFASDAQKGVQLLHLFIMDMLERDSPEAQVFRTKIEADFNYTTVITNLTRKLVILVIVILNIVLILLTITRAVKRDYFWQRTYIFLYMWVLLFEFFGFEPAECIWMHYVLPHLIQSDVEEAVRVLYRAVDFAFSNLALDNIIVDVPSYFFLSTQVAREYSEMFESSIILSYQTYMGLKIVKKAPISFLEAPTLFDELAAFLSAITLRSILISTNHLPLSLRKCVFHSLTPLFLILLLLLVRKIYHHPLYILAPVVMSFLLFCIYARVRKHWVLKRRLKVSALTEMETYHKRIDPTPKSDSNSNLPNKPSDHTIASSESVTGGIVFRSPRKLSNEPQRSDSDNRSPTLGQDGVHAQQNLVVAPVGYGIQAITIGGEEVEKDDLDAKIILNRSNSLKSCDDPTILRDPERPSLVSYDLGLSGKSVEYTLPENARLRASSEIENQIGSIIESEVQSKKARPNYRGAFSLNENDSPDFSNNTVERSISLRRKRSIQKVLSKKMSGTVKKIFSRVISRQFSARDDSSDDYDSSDFSESRFSFDSDDDFSDDELDVISIDRKIDTSRRQFPSSP